MSRYDGLIIPRSYSEYINKTDAATLSAAIAQAMQLGGVSDAYPTANSTKIAQSGGIFKAAQILAATSTTITGAAISAGSIVRVFFTVDVTGTDTTTGLVLSYNGVNIPVKACKDGAQVDFVANAVELPTRTENTRGENTRSANNDDETPTRSATSYVYCQRYTTLELYYDGTNFVIIGNPVVISTADYTIYTDGTSKYTKTAVDNSFQPIGYYPTRVLFQFVNNASVEFTLVENVQYLLVNSYNVNNYLTLLTRAWGGSIASQNIGATDSTFTISKGGGKITMTGTGNHLVGIYRLS